MRPRLVAIVLLGLSAASCRPEDQRTDTLDPQGGMQAREEMPAEVVAQLDSGSAAFRAQDFEAALRHYRVVTELDASVGAGWFGVYMAEDALGRHEAAQEALERVQDLEPGASLLREEGPPP